MFDTYGNIYIYELWILKRCVLVIAKRTKGNIDHMLKNLQTIRQLIYVSTHEV